MQHPNRTIRPRPAARAGATFASLLLVVTTLLWVSVTTPAIAQDDAAKAPPTVLITGANRGLGLEFARQLHAAGATVIGTARRPDAADELEAIGVRVEQLDVTDAASVTGLAERLGDIPIDMLINNAGIIGGRAATLDDVDPEMVARTYDVNCLGPMRVTQALLPALRRGEGKKVVNISSALGSIDRNTGGGYYGYRESKAALNMFTRSIAGQLADDGFICIVMSPGWVQTDMGGPQAALTPEESIRGMLTVIDELTPAKSGRFFNHKGDELPW